MRIIVIAVDIEVTTAGITLIIAIAITRRTESVTTRFGRIIRIGRVTTLGATDRRTTTAVITGIATTTITTIVTMDMVDCTLACESNPRIAFAWTSRCARAPSGAAAFCISWRSRSGAHQLRRWASSQCSYNTSSF